MIILAHRTARKWNGNKATGLQLKGNTQPDRETPSSIFGFTQIQLNSPTSKYSTRPLGRTDTPTGDKPYTKSTASSKTSLKTEQTSSISNISIDI